MKLQIELLSDGTFSRGDGVAGLVDTETAYDEVTGLPLIHGRTLKGLLVEACADVLFALGSRAKQFNESALFLFGRPGSSAADRAKMHIGHAHLPESFCNAVKDSFADNKNDLTKSDVLGALTTIRRQTAVDAESGAPDDGSLRAVRVVLRETAFFAPLHFREKPTDQAWALLAASVAAVRRGGLNRNRGSGKLTMMLLNDDDQDVTDSYLGQFATIVEGK